jgi:hypothetical protein
MNVITVKGSQHGLSELSFVRLIEFSSKEVSEFSARRHDLLEAIQQIEASLQFMSQGFDFTTPKGSRLLNQLNESVYLLKSEVEALVSIYREV